MATDNKGVMIYLPKDLEEYITNFCTENDITRKDKDGNLVPSLGTGVVTYLKRNILSQSPDNVLPISSQPISTGLNEQEVLDLIDQYFTNKLPSENSVRTSINETINIQEVRTSEEDSICGIDNALHQALISLDVPNREEFARLKHDVKVLQREVIKQSW